jgi:hypothetical protein
VHYIGHCTIPFQNARSLQRKKGTKCLYHKQAINWVKCSPHGPALGLCGDSCTKLCNKTTDLLPYTARWITENLSHGQSAITKLVTNLFKGQIILDTSYVTCEVRCRESDMGIFNCNVMLIFPEKRRRSKKKPKQVHQITWVECEICYRM